MVRWVLGASLICGCVPVEPAPTELDALTHWFWQHLDDADDRELAVGFANAHLAVGGDALEDVLDGRVSSLDDDAAALVGREDADPSAAVGVFIARPVDCTMDVLEAVLTAKTQDALYTGVYDAYERTFLSDPGAFLSGASDTVGWRAVYSSTVLGASYSADSVSLMRRVPTTDGEPGGLIARAVLVEPAVFEGGNHFIEQDYHLELYWDRGDTLLHVYVNWKNNRLMGFEDEAEVTQRLVINNLARWDDGTETLCAAGMPTVP